MADITDELSSIARCRRCECLSCGRDPAGELHGHICTDGEHCVETRDSLRKFRYAAAVVAGKARQEIRKLRKALSNDLAARSGP